MSQAIYASFSDPSEAESLVGSLLELGAIPEDISLIAALPPGAVERLEIDYTPALKMVDAGQARLVELRFGQRRIQKEGSEFYESGVGGGISTSTPDDDVSGPEELDDSESAAEDMSQPVGEESFGAAELHDADAFAQSGTLDPLSRRLRRHLMTLPTIAQVSSIAMPGMLILGDGPLALKVLETDLSRPQLSPAGVLQNSLRAVGLSLEYAMLLAEVMANGGAVISIMETVGILPLEALEALVENSAATNLAIIGANATFSA